MLDKGPEYNERVLFVARLYIIDCIIYYYLLCKRREKKIARESAHIGFAFVL